MSVEAGAGSAPSVILKAAEIIVRVDSSLMAVGPAELKRVVAYGFPVHGVDARGNALGANQARAGHFIDAARAGALQTQAGKGQQLTRTVIPNKKQFVIAGAPDGIRR